MGRIVSLVLVSPAGDLLGMLAPLELACPFWQECADIVAEVAARFSARVVVLRLLVAKRPESPGGQVTYLARLRSAAVDFELLPVPQHRPERAQPPAEIPLPRSPPSGPT